MEMDLMVLPPTNSMNRILFWGFFVFFCFFFTFPMTSPSMSFFFMQIVESKIVQSVYYNDNCTDDVENRRTK